MKELSFICSPFSGDKERNIEYAKTLCRLAIYADKAPFAPHLMYPQFLNEETPIARETGIICGLAFLAYCDEIWVGEKYGISPGMKREIKEARRLKIPVRYYK